MARLATLHTTRRVVDRSERNVERRRPVVAKRSEPVKKVVKRVKRDKPPITEGLRPIREKLSQAETFATIADFASEATGRDYTVKDVKAIWAAAADVFMAQIMPKGAGKAVMPGIGMIVVKDYPKKIRKAIPPGTLVRNPRTGEEVPHAGRPKSIIPATSKPKIRPQAKLKAAVLGN